MSKREYLVMGFEDNEPLQFELSALELFHVEQDKNPTEVLITLSEQIDEILDLPVNGTLVVSLIRGNIDSRGILKRIQ